MKKTWQQIMAEKKAKSKPAYSGFKPGDKLQIRWEEWMDYASIKSEADAQDAISKVASSDQFRIVGDDGKVKVSK